MAPRLMRWTGWVFGGILLVALWALPPRAREDWFPGTSRTLFESFEEDRAFRKILREVQHSSAVYKKLVWNDSIEVLARLARGGGQGIWAQLPDSVPPDSRSTLEEAVRRQLQDSGLTVPQVPVGVALMDPRYGVHPDTPDRYAGGSGWEIFVNRDAGESYCFLVNPVYDTDSVSARRALARLLWSGPDSSLVPNPVGPCILHAKYGNPGDGTFSWLRSGGYQLAEGSMGPWVQRDLAHVDPVSRGFGTRLAYRLSPHGAACVQGAKDVCLKLFRMVNGGGYRSYNDLWSSELSPPGAFPVAYRTRGSLSGIGLGGEETGLLFRLEEEFGEERFREFWTSDQDVEVAFQAAFGEPVEEWLVRWAQARWGELDLGPRIPLQATLLSFLSLGLFMGLALVMGRRKA